MTKRVVIELMVPVDITMTVSEIGKIIKLPGFKIDPKYKPVQVSPPENLAAELIAKKQKILLVRGEIDEDKENDIKLLRNVINVWTDAKIEPTEIDFDCRDDIAKGTINEVAKYLRCDRLWAKGVKGDGIVIGICDTGVDNSKIPVVIGGWSPDSSSSPGIDENGHGTMVATDALGMCPEAKIYDLGILKETSSDSGVLGVLSDAIAAFQWALDQYKKNRTPQILSNSWSLYNESLGPDYATDINHPFNRKVAEAVDAGIIVLFCAGNCGSYCPDSRCKSDTGPGKGIWGANGHPKVITVAAANIHEQWIGYTSQGPAALDFKKPDFCAPSHFEGYTPCDSGTSAATPICAGVIGLLKSKDMGLSPEKVKEALQKTAKNLLSLGWDPNSGYGMIQAESAFNYLFPESEDEPVEPDLSGYTMWMHGSSTHEECPTRLKDIRRAGFYAVYEGNPGTINQFHYAIPTPAILNGKRLKLDSVMLLLITDPDVYITNIHIYDGNNKIESYDGLSLTGPNLFKQLVVRNDSTIQFGVGISIGVRFGEKNEDHR
ncbi:MAG: hypothetical protein E4G94_02515, partial [ANME-2 cluster archaeon]